MNPPSVHGLHIESTADWAYWFCFACSSGRRVGSALLMKDNLMMRVGKEGKMDMAWKNAAEMAGLMKTISISGNRVQSRLAVR